MYDKPTRFGEYLFFGVADKKKAQTAWCMEHLTKGQPTCRKLARVIKGYVYTSRYWTRFMWDKYSVIIKALHTY